MYLNRRCDPVTLTRVISQRCKVQYLASYLLVSHISRYRVQIRLCLNKHIHYVHHTFAADILISVIKILRQE